MHWLAIGAALLLVVLVGMGLRVSSRRQKERGPAPGATSSATPSALLGEQEKAMRGILAACEAKGREAGVAEAMQAWAEFLAQLRDGKTVETALQAAPEHLRSAIRKAFADGMAPAGKDGS